MRRCCRCSTWRRRTRPCSVSSTTCRTSKRRARHVPTLVEYPRALASALIARDAFIASMRRAWRAPQHLLPHVRCATPGLGGTCGGDGIAEEESPSRQRRALARVLHLADVTLRRSAARRWTVGAFGFVCLLCFRRTADMCRFGDHEVTFACACARHVSRFQPHARRLAPLQR